MVIRGELNPVITIPISLFKERRLSATSAMDIPKEREPLYDIYLPKEDEYLSLRKKIFIAYTQENCNNPNLVEVTKNKFKLCAASTLYL